MRKTEFSPLSYEYHLSINGHIANELMGNQKENKITILSNV